MTPRVFAGACAVAMVICAAPGWAQQASPNPMDAVPEKMPFDVPYGAPISLERADAALNAALAESRGRGWKLNCAVVDSGANLVTFEAGIQGGANYLITLDDVIGSRGGIPLVEGGKLIGAIGCSGGTGSQDEVASKAGAATVK
jgi:glc operon protein GlcG